MIKESYEHKGAALKMMKGERDVKLPLFVFLDGVEKTLIRGCLKQIIDMTTNSESEFYVSGYSIIAECLWPMILHALDTQLSFVLSQTSLLLFRHNFTIAKDFIARHKHLLSDFQSKGLIEKFSL